MNPLTDIFAWIGENEAVLSGIAAIIVVIGVFLSPLRPLAARWLRGEGASRRKDTRIPVGEDRPSLLVLPFKCLDDDPKQMFAASAMTEDLTTLLARAPGFTVLANSTAATFAAAEPDVRSIGRELDVRYVVEGTMRPVGKNVRVIVRLVDTTSAAQIWSDQYDWPIEEIAELQDEIAQKLAAELGSELTRAEVERVGRMSRRDLDAYRLYQMARLTHAQGGWNAPTVEAVQKLLREALTKDPRFAPASAYLSLILAFGQMFGLIEPSDEVRAEIDQLAKQTLENDNRSSDVLGFVGCAIADTGDIERGLPLIERAVEANPSNAVAYAALGETKRRIGDYEGAIEQLEKAMRLSPRDFGLSAWLTFLGMALQSVGRLEDAEQAFRKSIELDADFAPARVMLAVVAAADERGRDEVALHLEKAEEANPAMTRAMVKMIGSPGKALLEQAMGREIAPAASTPTSAAATS